MAAFFAVMSVAVMVALQRFYSSDKELRQKGTDVEAVIISSEETGGKNEVEVEYTDEDGKTVKAKGIVNDGILNEGRVFKGKVMPGEPDKVTQPYKNSFKWTIYGAAALFMCVALFAEYKLIRGLLLRNSVGAHGVTARAQVVSYDPGTRKCTINFQRADGIDCNVTVHSDVAYATGGYINIRYIPKGKSARVIILGY